MPFAWRGSLGGVFRAEVENVGEIARNLAVTLSQIAKIVRVRANHEFEVKN